MSAKIIDGKTLAATLLERVAREVEVLRSRKRPVCLASLRIGEDSAAASYSRSQALHAWTAGIDYRPIILPCDSALDAVADAIDSLNADESVTGIMLHLPVPSPLQAFVLQQRIAPGKDVEGVSAANLGLLAMGREALVPCTAAAAFACLTSTGVDIRGKRAVVVGRSLIVGKPLAMLLLAAHATVTQCHTQTRDLASHTRSAEILMVAAGRQGLIGSEHVAPGTVVIDVGIHKIAVKQPDATVKVQTVGDVRFDEVAPIASHITPVPGGVGPLTVAMLLANVVAAAGRV